MIPPNEPALPRFETVRALGAGGGGRVRLVRDRGASGGLRALKLGITPAGEDPGAVRAALLREARALASFRHPGVPRLFEAGVARDGTPWLLLEYVEAADVRDDRVPRGDGASSPDGDRSAFRAHVVATARGLLETLAYLHRYGWLHRDVKPQNVVTARSGRVVLLDYGLAAREDEVLPARGTLPYVSPEVLAGDPADLRSDLWSAGAALVVLATGQSFAPGTVLGPEHVPDDAALPADWLRCLLHSRRERRPETSDRALTDLDAALGRPPASLPRRALPHAPLPAGRSSEIDTIVRRLTEAAAAGEIAATDAPQPPGLVLVRGEAGVGKSRLIQELRLRAIAEGWAPLWGSCSDERDAPLPAVRSILDQAALLAGGGSAALRRRVRALHVRPESRPDGRPDGRTDGRTDGRVDGRVDDDLVETAARFLVDLSAETGGLLVVAEDLQDATALSLRVLATVVRIVSESHALGTAPRLLVVLTLTDGPPLSEEVDEGLRALEGEGLLQTVPLRPLGPDDVAGLVRGVLGPSAPHERIAEILRAHGGALPLFAEELLARLVEDGALRHDGHRWALDPRHTPSLPATLTGAVRARLDRLGPRERRAVQILATHELPLPRARAERLLGAGAIAVLAALEAQGLVARGADGGPASLAHSVIGQTALAMLDARARAGLNDLVAASLPRADPETAIRRAHHISRGTNPDAGLLAATETARRLRDDGEPGRAAAFVRQALRLLPDGDPRVPRLRRSLADLLARSGRPEAAANVFRDLLADERDPVSRAGLLVGLADALDAGGLHAEAKPVCREGLDVVARLPEADLDSGWTRLALLARLASAQRATGELRESIETVKAALALTGPERAAESASLLSLLGNVHAQMGDLVRARQFHASCLAACRGLGTRRGMASALHNLGVVHARLGERDDAIRCYRQALRLARRDHDPSSVAQTLGNLGNLRAAAGDLAGADRLHRRSLAIWRRSGDRTGTAVAFGNIAGLHRARGRLGRALALLQSAVKRLRAAGDVEGESEFLLQAAFVHLWANDLTGARPLLARALDLAQRGSLRGPESEAELLLGRLERRADPQDDAWTIHLARAKELSELVGDRVGAAEALLETALGERDRGRRGSAMRAWRQATELLAGTGAADAAARADLVRGRLAFDRATGDRATGDRAGGVRAAGDRVSERAPETGEIAPAPREPDVEALAALDRYHAWAVASGRRDQLATACLALGRARLRIGDAVAARKLLAQALEVEEDLAASLPPALRKSRENSPVRGLLATLRAEAENAAPAGRPPEDAAGGAPDDMDQDRLLKLLEINKQLNQAQDMGALLDAIMDVAIQATGAERGFLVVVRPDGKLKIETGRHFRREALPTAEWKVSKSVVMRVVQSGQPVDTESAKEDERFARAESVDQFDLKSILAVPFRVGSEVIGAVYVDNSQKKGVFRQGDLQFLVALGDQAAIAIRNLRQAEQMATLNRQLAKNLESKSAQLEVASRALSERATKYPYDEIVGTSPQIREVLLLLDKVVDTDVPVLIQGDSGTGKELIARAIHQYGRRKAGPFVGVNCGAITSSLMESELFGHVRGAFTGAVVDKKGLFEAAHNGTIFLDEIGEMDVEMQKKLLRVLQEREVRPVGGKAPMKIDVRVIAATNRDLRKMTQEGRFREDLFYRIAVISLTMPPLRDRAEDIPPILEHCVRRAGRELGLAAKPFDDDAMDAIQAYGWPGNVRELDNEVKKALTLSGDRVTLADLSSQVQAALRAPEAHGPEPALVAAGEGGKLKESLEKTEKALIERALDHTAGNQTRAARELGISRVWLRKKMEKYGLLPDRP